MATDIVIPNVGESVTEGVIAAWLKNDGDYVEQDDTLIELETDKITMEVPAPASGVLKRSASEGDTVEVGAVVGSIDESAEKPSGGSSESSKQDGESKKAEGAADDKDGESKSSTATAEKPKESDQDSKKSSKEEPKPSKTKGSPAPDASPASNGSAQGRSETKPKGDIKATPLAEKIAGQFNIDLSRVKPTGAGSRIREQDVLAYLQAHPDGDSDAPASAGASGPSRSTSVEKMSPMRQRIAQRLVEAQQTAAMLTTFNECDMTNVMALRKKYKEEFGEKHGVNLGFMSFFVAATCSALKAFPAVNSYIVEQDGKPALKGHDFCDVAIAVSSPKGLVVPVLRNAESMSFDEIEKAVKDYGTRAKNGKLELAEMQGGTFTITNGGIFGSLMSTPILNPPQSAILGMHAIKSRAVEDPDNPGQLALRPMMYLALSYDHRVVDGAGAVRFLVHIKDCIENPERLMLKI
ncbi:MAG: 2-oxoglutarate dehydrogenase complex dihydrolipoyllysine-residue succinyltransferase [Phycisphaerales bacterium]|nr:MAG: 2-oxoglutarate dehydrogenase complex dihydrolipoyllysine-residue succinyltransferase [Phycisphaerales bacterium]